MTGRAKLAAAAIACAVGGLLMLLSAGRRWSATGLRNPVNGGIERLTVTGHQVVSSLPAVGIATLALAAAIVASTGPVRRVVGGVTTLMGLIGLVNAVVGRGHVSHALEQREVGAQGIAVHAGANGWWVLAAVGGLIALAAGVATAARGPRWSAMSSRYDAPGGGGTAAEPARPVDPSLAAWNALDRGEDPTAQD